MRRYAATRVGLNSTWIFASFATVTSVPPSSLTRTFRASSRLSMYAYWPFPWSAICSIFASCRFPVPKPSTVRKVPLSRFSSMRRTISASLEGPTLKSPSVARMTRLLPSSRKCLAATS